MPHINIKATQALSREEKIELVKKLRSAWSSVSLPEVAKLIQFTIDEPIFSDFHGNWDDPSGIVQVQLAPLTPKEDLEKIAKAFFPILEEYLKAPKNRIHINFMYVEFWALNDEFADCSKK